MDSRTDEAVPNGWSRRVLGDVADISPESLSASTPPDSLFGYIDLSSVEKGRIHWDMVRTEAFRSAPSRARRAVRPGDVLFGTVRPALQSHGAITPHENLSLVASTGFSVIRARQSESWPRFLFHTILGETVSRAARRMEVGSNYPAVNESDVRLFPVLCPPVPEQRHIAAILDTLDEAIRKTEGIMVKLRQVEQGLLHDLLTRGVDESGGVRPLPSEAPGLYKNAGSDLIPTPWSTCPVGSVLARLEQGWSPDCSGHRAEHGEWGVLKTSAVTWDGYVDYQNKALPEGLPPKPEYEVHRLDVLITRAGPNSRVGVVAFVPKTQGRLMLSDKLYRLCPGREVTPRFLALALSAPRVQRHLSTLKTGLAESQTNISQAIVRELRMSLPPLSEQEAIVARFDAALDRAAAETRVLEKLATLRNGLAEDLLTGRVRVPMPEEATA